MIDLSNEVYGKLLRNPMFLNAYINSENREFFLGEQGLDKEYSQLILNIEDESLMSTADSLKKQRISKRIGEFRNFMNYLANYVNHAEFLDEFVFHNTQGHLLRKFELDRFRNFAAQYIVIKRLPEYLLEILNFDYHVAIISEKGRVKKEEFEERNHFDFSDSFLLKGPVKAVKFSYDILEALTITKDTPLRKDCTFLFIKSFSSIKTCIVLKVPRSWTEINFDEPIKVLDFLISDGADLVAKNQKTLIELVSLNQVYFRKGLL